MPWRSSSNSKAESTAPQRCSAYSRSFSTAQPDNLAVWLELARVAAKRGDMQTLQDMLARLEGKATAWPPVAQEQLRAVQTVAAEANPNRTAQHVMMLKNVLGRDAAYRQSRDAIQTPIGQEGEVISRFLRLPSPHASPAAPDHALTFAAEQLATGGGPWTWINALALDGEGTPAVLMANGHEVRIMDGAVLRFPGGPAGAAAMAGRHRRAGF